jgi:cysteine desulfurase / selenocysteine lyase
MWASLFPGVADRVWLNTAHQGPLPAVAVAAAERAIAEKTAPYRIPDDAFAERPERLRARLAGLVGGRPDEIVLGNSTSHGLHLVANGLPWSAGDEVIVVEDDYPATVLPFLRLARLGVRIRSVPREGLGEAITPRTRVMAVTWVDSFTGTALDLHALGARCRDAGALLVVNGSQAVGARPLDVSATPVDVVAACGYKWLCGPYGTGFTWIRPEVLAGLTSSQAYWLAQRSGGSLDHMREYEIRDLGVRGFDVFCPAAFLTNDPWSASVALLCDIGVERIAAHDQRLVQLLLDGVDPGRYELVSPAAGPGRSTLVVLRPRTEPAAAVVHRLAARGIDVAAREGNVRLTPHLFNTDAQIAQTCDALNTAGRAGR